MRAARSRFGARGFTSRLLHVEVRFCNGEQAVVACGLNVGFAVCARTAAWRERVERVADCNRRGRARAREQRRLARVEDSPLDVLNASVMAKIVHADVDVRQPENIRSIELGAGDFEPFRRDGDVDRFHVRQLKGGRKVDRVSLRTGNCRSVRR